MQRVVFDGRNRVRDISTARSFRGTLRRVLDVVHRRCDHPTCHVPAHHCQGDHVLPWSHGGTTSQHNGRLACGHHNRWWYTHQQRDHPLDPAPAPPDEAPPAASGPLVRRPTRRRWRRVSAHDPPDLAFARGELGDGTITIDLRPLPVDVADRP